MKDYDEDRQAARPIEDRQFKLRGHVFTVRPHVRPEAIAIIDDADFAPTSQDTLNEIDKGIREFLVPEDRDAWDRIRADDGDDIVTLIDLRSISQRLVREESTLPTEAPSASTDGRETTKPSSKAKSDSQEANPEA